MALDPSYLEYAHRKEGYDHDIYPWSSIFSRKPVAWPESKKVAVWLCVSLEWFPITPEDKPFRAPGHMQTSYPDYRHYTAREYGTRVGFYRLLDAFKKAGVKASIATNGAIAERYPEIIADILADGHEIIAHSTDMNGTIASGLPEAEEAALIAKSVAALQAAGAPKPKGWLSIARSQSFNTPRLLTEAGFDYACDWANDELPYAFNNGLINLPLNHELSDRQIITVQQQSADSYAQQIEDAFDYLSNEATQFGGRVLPLHITPYIMALPYRIAAFEALLGRLAAREEAWFATGEQIVTEWKGQQ